LEDLSGYTPYIILFSLLAGIVYLLYLLITTEPPHKRRQREREERREAHRRERITEDNARRRKQEREESNRRFAESNRRREEQYARERIRCSSCGTSRPERCCTCDCCLVCYPPGPSSYQEDQCDNCGWNIYMD